MNENINQLNENFETYQEILKDDMDYQNNNITSSNEQIKCYCGHTDYCDCGPLEEPKQETLEEAGTIAAGLCEHLEAKEQSMFIAGFQECAKWQKERMYSEEEVMDLFRKYQYDLSQWVLRMEDDINGKPIPTDWFKQFKKK